MAAAQPTTVGFQGSGGQPVLRSNRERAAEANQLLRHCGMCELKCGVDRTAGQRGRCGLDSGSHLYKVYVSGNEERELLPALRVFLGGCNLRCAFCDEAPDAFEADRGALVAAIDLAAELSRAVQSGIRTISVLGGEPTLHTHTILELADRAPCHLPLAINTNMYMTPAVLELLDGVVDWYLADFKFGNDECARRIAGVPDYSAILRRNLPIAARSANVIVRHVLLPGHLECCFRPVVDWCAGNLPGQRFQLYTGYVPCNVRDGELSRFNTPAEIAAAEAYLRDSGLEMQAPGKRGDCPPPPAAHGSHGDVTVTLGADGNVYCHDLPPEFAELLAGFQTPRTTNCH